ncbi:MAG TPA: hypothetical protein VMQ38_12275 [Mycobacterium sp.]|nr:hypothetical protein [Mycobacterium sp.]
MTDKGRVHLRDGTLVEWDVPTETDDSRQLRADIFRSIGPRPYRVLLSHRRAAKAASFQNRFEAMAKRLARDYPEVTRNTTNKYQNLWGRNRYRNID